MNQVMLEKDILAVFYNFFADLSKLFIEIAI